MLQTSAPVTADVSMTPQSAPTAAHDEAISASAESHASAEQQHHQQSLVGALSQPAAGQTNVEKGAAAAGNTADSAELAESIPDAISTHRIPLKLLQFFLHEGLQAVRGWGATMSPLPPVRPFSACWRICTIGLPCSDLTMPLSYLHVRACARHSM